MFSGRGSPDFRNAARPVRGGGGGSEGGDKATKRAATRTSRKRANRPILGAPFIVRTEIDFTRLQAPATASFFPFDVASLLLLREAPFWPEGTAGTSTGGDHRDQRGLVDCGEPHG
ncbi:hypothetical protein MRX96_000385 [Rhipicephalus microplus]